MSLLVPRQAGSTTTAQSFAEEFRATRGGDIDYFDLEHEVSLRRLAEHWSTLDPLRGLVVIDEVQHQPELFRQLRVLVDRPGVDVRFLLLGSATPAVVKGVSESLAGRVAMIDLPGFVIDEVAPAIPSRVLWTRGGFPRSLPSPAEEACAAWRVNFLKTFVELGTPLLGTSPPAQTLLRFWRMVARYHGNVINYAELARSIGLGETTARRYVDLLAGTYMVRLLRRVVFQRGQATDQIAQAVRPRQRAFHTLMELPHRSAIESSPKLGASWDGFALEQC